MQTIISALRGILSFVLRTAGNLWRRFLALKLWQKALVIIGIVAVIIGLSMLFSGGKPTDTGNQARTVTLRSVGELSGNATGDSVIGTVRSRSEANVIAEAGGVVKSVNTSLGAAVPAGFVIGSLENSTESATLLQAQGAYDAAVAAKTSTSLSNTTATAGDAFRSAYATLDATLTDNVDLFFGSETATGPTVTINTNGQADVISKGRKDIRLMMERWSGELSTAGSKSPLELLNEASTNVRQVSLFLNDLASAANARDSRATETQLAALSAARTTVNTLLSTLSAAQTSYRTSAVGATSASDASVKSALGTLRLAEANYEKTLLRAPIAGQVNFLPIRVGDYVNALTHVATVAQNGALEIVFYISEDVAAALHTGARVTVEGSLPGVITEMSPALDPITKQIEAHAAITGDAKTLVNGQSVRIALPSTSISTATSSGPVLLPLSAVKLSAGTRVLFTVGTDGRLVALPVTIGEVRGDRIEITSLITAETRVVEDARGLSEGDKVNVAP
mgnify:CR=1 FL=1